MRVPFTVNCKTLLAGVALAVYSHYGLTFPLRFENPGQDSLKMEKAHEEIWRRFVDEHGIVIDFADENGHFVRPDAEEFRTNKPNALGWWTPTENGAMFNGLYLDGICQRWLRWGRETDRRKAKRLVDGLLLLATIGDTPGFIARGLATDGKTPPSMGSNDQALPWFYGLWRYIHSGLATEVEQKVIIAQMEKVAEVWVSTEWRIPTASYAPARFRNSFATINWEGAPRMLFILKAMHHLTGQSRWAELYKQSAFQKSPTGESRLQVCSEGMRFDIPKQYRWTGVTSSMALRGLWEMESDTGMKDFYRKGLNASAQSAVRDVGRWKKFDNQDKKTFLHDWRTLNQLWKPQQTEQDALDVAQAQLTELVKRSPRRDQELAGVREPLWMAWIVTLAPDQNLANKHRSEILDGIAHFNYEGLYYSQFFPAETVWIRLQKSKP